MGGGRKDWGGGGGTWRMEEANALASRLRKLQKLSELGCQQSAGGHWKG
jgi:hypothetical protein